MISFSFSWLLLFILCSIKNNFLQNTLELQIHKSKYFTGKKIQENPAYVQKNVQKMITNL